MATATAQLPIKQLRAKKPPAPTQRERLESFTASIQKSLLPDLAEMFKCARRGDSCLDLSEYLGSLIASHIADFRRMRIRPELSFIDNLDDEGIPAGKDVPSGYKLSAEEVQRAIHLFFSERIPIGDIATRLGRGRSSIRRAIEAYESRQHHDFCISAKRVRSNDLNLGDLSAPAHLSHNDRF